MGKTWGTPHIKAVKVGDRLVITAMGAVMGGVRPVGKDEVDLHDEEAIRECVVRIVDIARSTER